MIAKLYEKFRPWSEGGSIWIISDTHFGDQDCLIMDKKWITPEEQVERINIKMMNAGCLIHLGDVGQDYQWMNKIKCKYKILILGNHDNSPTKFRPYFDEIYTGPLFIADKILLSHEPITLPFCLNIHGHDHNEVEYYEAGCKHINLAANVCNYTPINLGKLIKEGILKDISSIHRITINRATGKKK